MDYVRRAEWGMLYADDACIVSRSPQGLARRVATTPAPARPHEVQQTAVATQGSAAVITPYFVERARSVVAKSVYSKFRRCP